MRIGTILPPTTCYLHPTPKIVLHWLLNTPYVTGWDRLYLVRPLKTLPLARTTQNTPDATNISLISGSSNG
ncbi:hypothetical protein ARMSODRAFT_619726 [Armillaria solidipes]|uniref:Uncharacterized protein n=1 Tax=Armillaria solidipes TaxID=1076256 RepID=A0A2H3B4K6_9AGAR|nr:hypothetical protein ARMSODRAFT_619726 [Armillaria solidipes]